MRHPLLLSCLSLVALLAPTFPRSAQAAPADGEFRWEGRVQAGRTVEIKGVNGSVEADMASGDHVQVVATKNGRRDDPSTVRIDVVEHAGGVTVCAVYPDVHGKNVCAPGDGGRMNVQNNDVRVNFRIRVPAGVEFIGRTVNGSVAAESLQGVVRVSTVNGSARFSTTEYGEAETVNGDVSATMGRGKLSEDLDFRSVNGTITVTVGSDLHAAVDAETLNGSITSDFPLQTTKLSRRRVRGIAGNGGRHLSLSSVNGSIKLKRD